MCHSVCVSLHLFTVTLKFLKTHSYGVAQVLNVNLVTGLEFKMRRLLIEMLRNPSKNREGGVSSRVWEKIVSSAT